MKKRITVVLIILAVLAATGIAAYAVNKFIIKSGTQESDYEKKVYFEFEMSDVFTEGGEIGPGESKTIKPFITSKASMPMYVFIRVEMPVFDGGGLYELNSGWTKVEEKAVGDQWIEVYRYGELSPGQSTSALASSITMKHMSLEKFAEVDNVNVSMTGYSVGTDEEELENAWNDIKGHYGLQ